MVKRPEVAHCTLTPGIEVAGVIDTLIDYGADALILHTNGPFPKEVFPKIQRAREREVPVIVPSKHVWEPIAQAKTQGIEGLVAIDAYPEEAWGIHEGVRRILEQEQRYERRVTRIEEVFAREPFYRQREFLDLVINPTLKEYADSLPLEAGPIIVDCGHIDSPRYSPTDADQQTLRDGVIMMQYLRLLGHQDVKLGFLINEMHLFKERSKREARAVIRRLRKQAKRNGLHYLGDRMYRMILNGFGVHHAEYADNVVCRFEGSLNLQARQEVSAYEAGEEHPFQHELDPYGRVGTSFETVIDGRPFERVLTHPESGAPLCALQSARLTHKYDEGDVGTVVYLRDNKWRSGVICGARTARAIYGSDVNVKAFFYTGKRPNVRMVDHKTL